jgi:hypothetical protein
VKGTKRWQGPGSPLILGRSRQIRPLWQPWLGAVVLSIAISNAVTWLWYTAFALDLFIVSSMVGALAGVWLSRVMGWRRSWVLGTVVGVLLNAVVFAAALRWMPASLWHIRKVG